jgi:GNAT superfamily N-acetyltransferase
VALLRIEKLQRIHAIDAFDCGRETLNLFLIRYAFQNQQAEASQTYLALSDEELVGYYTLVVGQVEYNDAPERLTKGLARHPVPIMLLARLAVATSWQGKGIGAGLLKDAMLRTLQAADIRTSPAFARLRFTRRTTKPEPSMSTSTLSHHQATPFTCSVCSRISASFFGPNRLPQVPHLKAPGQDEKTADQPNRVRTQDNQIPISASEETVRKASARRFDVLVQLLNDS